MQDEGRGKLKSFISTGKDKVTLQAKKNAHVNFHGKENDDVKFKAKNIFIVF